MGAVDELGHSQADVRGAVVLVFQLCAHGGTAVVGLLRHDDERGTVAGKFVHTQALGGGAHSTGRAVYGHIKMVWLAVAGAGRKARGFQHLRQHGAVRCAHSVKRAAALVRFGHFFIVHSKSPCFRLQKAPRTVQAGR